MLLVIVMNVEGAAVAEVMTVTATMIDIGKGAVRIHKKPTRVKTCILISTFLAGYDDHRDRRRFDGPRGRYDEGLFCPAGNA